MKRRARKVDKGYDFFSKEKQAIEFLKEHEPPEGYYLAFSGGKDSSLMRALAIKAKVKHVSYYACTGIDPPELVKFIRKECPDVKFLFPKKSFYALIPKYGYPTRISRWCCDKLKKEPTKAIPLNNRLVGIRAEESVRRARWGQIEHHGQVKDWKLYKPIFHWLLWEVWDYIERNNIPYCSLYDEGFERLGCVVCPFICSENMAEVNRHRDRWPKFYVAFEKAMLKLYKRRKAEGKWEGYTNFPHVLSNWYRGANIVKKTPKEEDKGFGLSYVDEAEEDERRAEEEDKKKRKKRTKKKGG